MTMPPEPPARPSDPGSARPGPAEPPRLDPGLEVDADARTPPAPFQPVATRAADGTVHVRAPASTRSRRAAAAWGLGAVLTLAGAAWLLWSRAPEAERIELQRGTEVVFRGAWGEDLPPRVVARAGDRLRIEVPFRGGYAAVRMEGPLGRRLLDVTCPAEDPRCVAEAVRVHAELIDEGTYHLRWIRSREPIPRTARGGELEGLPQGEVELEVE